MDLNKFMFDGKNAAASMLHELRDASAFYVHPNYSGRFDGADAAMAGLLDPELHGDFEWWATEFLACGVGVALNVLERYVPAGHVMSPDEWEEFSELRFRGEWHSVGEFMLDLVGACAMGDVSAGEVACRFDVYEYAGGVMVFDRGWTAGE